MPIHAGGKELFASIAKVLQDTGVAIEGFENSPAIGFVVAEVEKILKGITSHYDEKSLGVRAVFQQQAESYRRASTITLPDVDANAEVRVSVLPTVTVVENSARAIGVADVNQWLDGLWAHGMLQIGTRTRVTEEQENGVKKIVVTFVRDDEPSGLGWELLKRYDPANSSDWGLQDFLAHIERTSLNNKSRERDDYTDELSEPAPDPELGLVLINSTSRLNESLLTVDHSPPNEANVEEAVHNPGINCGSAMSLAKEAGTRIAPANTTSGLAVQLLTEAMSMFDAQASDSRLVPEQHRQPDKHWFANFAVSL